MVPLFVMLVRHCLIISSGGLRKNKNKNDKIKQQRNVSLCQIFYSKSALFVRHYHFCFDNRVKKTTTVYIQKALFHYL